MTSRPAPPSDARLAGEGVTFTDVYSQSPKTDALGTLTLLTSLYPSVHGVELWAEREAGARLNPAGCTPWAEILKERRLRHRASRAARRSTRCAASTRASTSTREWQQRRARRWLGRHRWQRFFVFYHTYDVHDPYLPPDEYIRLFDPDYRGRVLDAIHRLRNGGRDERAAWESISRRFWTASTGATPATCASSSACTMRIRRMDTETIRPLLDRSTSSVSRATRWWSSPSTTTRRSRARAVPARRPLRRHGARGARAALAGAAARGLRIASRVRLIDVHADHPGAASACPRRRRCRGRACTSCTTPTQPATEGAVSEYSDGRLYESLAAGAGSATSSTGRRAPLRPRPRSADGRTCSRPAPEGRQRCGGAGALRAGTARAHGYPLSGRAGTIAPSDETRAGCARSGTWSEAGIFRGKHRRPLVPDGRSR